MLSFKGIILKYLFKKSRVRYCAGASGHIGANVEILRSSVIVLPGANLTIEEGCSLRNVNIYVGSGSVSIGHDSILAAKDGTKIGIIVDKGSISIGHHTKVACKSVWVRFGGRLSIGDYTNVNEGSEIRCDEQISIGSFNQISYNVMIWDTNTHNILPKEARRRLTIDKFPYFGFEGSRPQALPIHIGDDCWIGESAAILKGSQIGDGCIIGFRALVSGKNISPGCTVVNDINLRISHNAVLGNNTDI